MQGRRWWWRRIFGLKRRIGDGYWGGSGAERAGALTGSCVHGH